MRWEWLGNEVGVAWEWGYRVGLSPICFQCYLFFLLAILINFAH